MDRAQETRSAISQAIDKFGLFRACGDDYVVTSERAHECAAAIFDVLDQHNYFKPALATERKRIISAITPALGDYDMSPGACPPGQWARAVRPTPPETDTIADEVYSNLVHRGYITA